MKAERHVLITGGAVYIGSLLTSELLLNNYRVTVVDNLPDARDRAAEMADQEGLGG